MPSYIVSTYRCFFTIPFLCTNLDEGGLAGYYKLPTGGKYDIVISTPYVYEYYERAHTNEGCRCTMNRFGE